MPETKGIEVFLQVAPEEPIIEEGGFLLVGEVWFHHLVEELRILLQEEEVQFVASVLGVFLTLFLLLHVGPVENKSKLPQSGVVTESEQEIVSVTQVVDYM